MVVSIENSTRVGSLSLAIPMLQHLLAIGRFNGAHPAWGDALRSGARTAKNNKFPLVLNCTVTLT